jgi:hypothetical protein
MVEKLNSFFDAKESKVLYKLQGYRLCQKGFCKVLGCDHKGVGKLASVCVETKGKLEPRRVR